MIPISGSHEPESSVPRDFTQKNFFSTLYEDTLGYPFFFRIQASVTSPLAIIRGALPSISQNIRPLSMPTRHPGHLSSSLLLELTKVCGNLGYRLLRNSQHEYLCQNDMAT